MQVRGRREQVRGQGRGMCASEGVRAGARVQVRHTRTRHGCTHGITVTVMGHAIPHTHAYAHTSCTHASAHTFIHKSTRTSAHTDTDIQQAAGAVP